MKSYLNLVVQVVRRRSSVLAAVAVVGPIAGAIIFAAVFTAGIANAQTVGEIVAPTPKSSPEEIAKDFYVACEMSKLSLNLAKTPPFKDQAADLSYRVSEMMSGALRTHEVKEAHKAITQAKPEDRVKLWYEAAAQNGLKGFKCKTIGFR